MKYFKLIGCIEKETNKAYGVAVGSNNAVTRDNIRVYIEWIAKSQIKEVDNNIYIPQWIINSNRVLQNEVDFKDFIEVDDQKKKTRKRRTKEQMQQDEYKEALENYFNNEVPNEYIELHYEVEGEKDIRFTRIERLNKIKEREELKKIVIVKNGEKIIHKEF